VIALEAAEKRAVDPASESHLVSEREVGAGPQSFIERKLQRSLGRMRVRLPVRDL
jgi:hypothetical protein